MPLLMLRARLLIQVSALALTPLWAMAQTTHVVQVFSNYFEPSEITIQAGDTVRWENPPDGGFHNVVAEDFSWSSGATVDSFTFERTFIEGGDHPYFCQPHRVEGMEGVITVQGSVEPQFEINAGLNDSWYNAATPGQGFFITVFSDLSTIFLAWFTYDTERPDGNVTANLGEPGHRWLTAFGEYSGAAAMLDVELSEGGVFNSGEPAVTQTADGSILLECSGCNACTVTYDITSTGVQGVVPIERIALDNLAACEAFATNR